MSNLVSMARVEIILEMLPWSLKVFSGLYRSFADLPALKFLSLKDGAFFGQGDATLMGLLSLIASL